MSVNERGDTIIEVLFAVAVFSLVAVGAISIMNQGTAMAQRALEIGLVRQQMDAQADALRYLNSTYIEDYHQGGVASDLWKAVVTDHKVTQAQDFDNIADAKGCHMPNTTDEPFALDVTQLSGAYTAGKANAGLLLVPTTDTPTYAKIRREAHTTAEGIWIQAVQSPSAVGYYDFHIRACWLSPGQAVPIKLGTIVRLYEPSA